MVQRIIITGLNGALGKNLLDSIPNKSNYKIASIFRQKKISFKNQLNFRYVYLDLLNTKKLKLALKKIKPDFIIHLAAITHIDNCEVDKKNIKKGIVWRTNVEITAEIVKYCKKNESHLIFLSTECVFDGKSQIPYFENQIVNPKNWYGKTKAIAEKKVLELGTKASIIRAVIAYDLDLKNKTIFTKLSNSFKRQEEFSVVDDQRFTPTYIGDIYQAIWTIIEKKLSGVFHIAPTKITTPYKFAKAIGQHFGYDLVFLKRKTMTEYFGLRKSKLRLKNACLNSKNSAQVLGIKPLTIEEALKKKS